MIKQVRPILSFFEIVRRICRFIWRLHSFPVYATMLLQICKEGLCKLHEQKWLEQGYLPN